MFQRSNVPTSVPTFQTPEREAVNRNRNHNPTPWQNLAACRGSHPDLFFTARGDNETVILAKTICGQCPVRAECLKHALDNNEVYGIWGGTSEHQRRKLKRTRKTHRVCTQCAQVFTPVHASSTLCSDECRRAARRQSKFRSNQRRRT